MTLSGSARPRALGAASRFDLVEDLTSVPRDESRRSPVPAPSAAAATDGGTVERAVQTTASRSNAESGADQPLPDAPLTDTAVPDAGTDVLGPALAAQAARDPRWPEALAQARWALRIGQRRRRPDGTVEDWVDPETRAELERRGRLRLAVYDAADAFVAREGRAPNKREQRQLVARVIVEEEETQQAWDAAAAAFARDDWAGARRALSAVATVQRSTDHTVLNPNGDYSRPDLRLVDEGSTEPRSTGGPVGRRQNRLIQRNDHHREQVEADERNLRTIARSWRAMGLVQAPDLLERFLDGDGSALVLSREAARTSQFVKTGERENNRRFINDTFTGNTDDRSITKCLRTLQEGGACIITDENEYERSGFGSFGGFVDQVGESSALDTFDDLLSFGSYEVVSSVAFTAARQGDIIRIVGTITHQPRDRYDFHAGGLGGLVGAYNVQEAGIGTPFDIRAAWSQRVEGTVRIIATSEDGEHILGDPRFRLWDVNP